MPWILNGALMMVPDRVPRVQRRVGVLEDHLHLAAQRHQLAPGHVGDVAARRTRRCPPVGCSSRSIARPAVDLPDPLSPTRPRVSPAWIVEVDPVDRLDLTDGALEDHDPSSRGSACADPDACITGASLTRASHGQDTESFLRDLAPALGGQMATDRRARRPSRPCAGGLRGRRCSGHLVLVGAAGPEDAARRQVDERRGLPGDRVEPGRPRPVHARHGGEQPEGVGHLRPVVAPRRPGPARPAARRTSPPRGRRPPRPRRGRG